MPSSKIRKINRKKIVRNKKNFYLKIIKIQSLVTAFVLILYLAVGFWIDPTFFKRDIKDKIAWGVGVSSLVSLFIVNNPPDAPIVFVESGCQEGSSNVSLSWGEDEKADSFDVYRDGEILFSGLMDNSYLDDNVSDKTSYSYYVIARGLTGETQSEEVSVETGDCYSPPLPPTPPPPEPEPESETEITCQFNTLDKIDLTRFKCLPKSDRKRPIFTGSTNVSYAKINLRLVRVKKSGRYLIMVANTVANKNGYWIFRTPEYIKRGRYIMYVVAIDPNDENRSAQASLRFNAVKVSTKKKILTLCWSTLKKKKTAKHSSENGSLGISIDIGKNNGYPGDILNINLKEGEKSSMISDNKDIQIRVIDANGQISFQDNFKVIAGKNNYTIKLPAILSSGNYNVQVIANNGSQLMTAENFLSIQEVPVVNFGGNITMTLSDVLSLLSTIVIVLLGIILLFLSLLFVEYWMSKNRLFEVDEISLKKRGYIS